MELRKARRLPLQLPVSFTSDEVTGTGIIYNLSKEGCAIESEMHMPMNSYLQLEVQMSPDQSPVFIEFAAVRWSTRTEFGAEFLTLREDSKKRIVKYLATTA
jgi:PilZ domain